MKTIGNTNDQLLSEIERQQKYLDRWDVDSLPWLGSDWRMKIDKNELTFPRKLGEAHPRHGRKAALM